MSSVRWWFQWVGLALLATLFLAGVVLLFQLRFSRGDVYPPYSTFRSDPLGTRVLYEAVNRLPQYEGQRFTGQLHQLPEPADQATLLMLGLDPNPSPMTFSSQGPGEDIDVLLQWIESGGRLVIALSPRSRSRTPHRDNEWTQARDESTEKSVEEYIDETYWITNSPRLNALAFKLNFTLTNLPAHEPPEHAESVTDPPFGATSRLPWQSPLALRVEDPWSILYAQDEYLFGARRTLGEGEVILLADAFTTSNEAMRKARKPEFLQGLIGSRPLVLFDETHLGVRRAVGIATLGRRYGFETAFLVFLGLALTFVWRQSLTLTPKQSRPSQQVVEGWGADHGLENLLQRHASGASPLDALLDEWMNSHAYHRLTPQRRNVIADTIQKLRQNGDLERDPLLAYNTLRQQLQHPSIHHGK